MTPAEHGYGPREHAELVEQLRRISTGIEVIVGQNDRMLDQLREITARFEAALKYGIQAWQAQQRRAPR
jgi:hypothetical protein